MNYKLVIFDFDGTLADSYPWFVSVFEELARKYRLPAVDKDHLDQLRSLDIHRIQKEYNIPLWKMLLIGNHLKKLMSSQIDKIQLVQGMPAVIAALRQRNIRLAIVTSNAQKNVQRVLGTTNMACFDWIETGASLFGKKGKFRKILDKAGVAAHEAFSIGDEVRDLQSSRELKIPFGAVTWGYTDSLTLQSYHPTAIFENPAQILASIG